MLKVEKKEGIIPDRLFGPSELPRGEKGRGKGRRGVVHETRNDGLLICRKEWTHWLGRTQLGPTFLLLYLQCPSHRVLILTLRTRNFRVKATPQHK